MYKYTLKLPDNNDLIMGVNGKLNWSSWWQPKSNDFMSFTYYKLEFFVKYAVLYVYLFKVISYMFACDFNGSETWHRLTSFWYVIPVVLFFEFY